MAFLRCPTIKQLLLIIFFIGNFVGCTPNIGHHVTRYEYNQYLGQVKEYVNRIGKRLIIVSESSNLAKLNIAFDLKNSHAIFFEIDTDKYHITISKGLLENLQDEAELCAILALSLVTLEHNNLDNIDQQIMNNIYKAEYDPMAFVELQEEYLANKDKNYNWLKVIFLSNITKNTVNINRKIAFSFSKGTQRGKDRYCSQMRLLKKLD